MSAPVLEVVDELREFMFSRVYTDSAAKEDDPKTHFVVHKLFEYFCAHPEDLPDEWRYNPRNDPDRAPGGRLHRGDDRSIRYSGVREVLRSRPLGGPFVDC